MIIFKSLYGLVIAKELGFNIGNSYNKNGTREKINSFTENDITNEHKEYLSDQNVIKLNNKTEILPLMQWIPRMHKNPVVSRFIIALPKCTLKPLSNNITAIKNLKEPFKK